LSDSFDFQTSLSLGEGAEAKTKSKYGEKFEATSDEDEQDSLIKPIEAIHAITTSNYTTYTANELRKSVNSWLTPYNKPVLTHHESRKGEPIGRVQEASFISNTKNGRPAHKLIVEITDPEAIQKIEDGRYSTVSVGGSADKAICSICETDWVSEGWCSHSPGSEYEDQVAHLIFKELDFKEVSFVNVPADEFAGIIEESSNSGSESLGEFISQDFYEQDKSNNGTNRPPESGGGDGGDNNEDTHNRGGYSMEPEERVDVLEEKVDTKNERIEVLEEKNDNLQEKNETLKEKNENLEEKIQTLEDEKDLLEDEMDELTEENEKLREKQHKRLAEKVVDKKIELDKIDEEEREDMLEEHVERTEDSLEDTLSDLNDEIERMEEMEEKQKEDEEKSEMGEEVDSEGLPLDEGDKVENEGDEEDDIDKEIAEQFS